MKEFIVVFHCFFVDSGYFEEKIIEAENPEQAQEKASRICYKKRKSGIDKWDYYIVKAEKEIKCVYNPSLLKTILKIKKKLWKN